ncbi:MAG: hypothetical protein KGI60_04455 [Patescibacteria group bacterium]|nr:hypothetical protein [Patescibacteria group bacterium]
MLCLNQNTTGGGTMLFPFLVFETKRAQKKKRNRKSAWSRVWKIDPDPSPIILPRKDPK